MIIKYHEKDKIWVYKYFEYFDTILNVPIMPIYRYFPSQKLAQKQYELASDHAKAYMRGEFQDEKTKKSISSQQIQFTPDRNYKV